MNFQDETNDAIALLQQLIAIQSYSKEENIAANFLERFIEINGYVASRKDNNVWLLSPGFDPTRTTILLNSHIDTVKPVSGWTREPFSPAIEGGKLFGLGSNDAGASVVSLLYAFFYLTKKQQNYNLIFAATAEEEISGKNGIESLLQELPKIDFAIVGEPTEMNMAVAEKGLMVLDCAVTGQAGHAARNEGVNAIYQALPIIEWFKNHDFERKSDLLGPVKMTVTQINAGTQHNVVPDNCTFVVDVRSNEMYSNQEILDEIRKFIGCEVQPRSTRLSSTATPLNHPIVKRGLELNRPVYGSPTLSDQALMSFPSMKMGPGQSSRSHTADEYILLDEIKEAIDIYIQLLDGLKL
jgi:acetylornithine deacetylase